MTKELIEQLRREWDECWTPLDEDFHAICDLAIKALEAPVTEAREKTVPELQAEIGRLTMELQFRVLGDPMGVVCTPSPQREKP